MTSTVIFTLVCFVLSDTRLPRGSVITPDLVLAVIMVESGGKSKAVGNAGERGLMQIGKAAWDDACTRRYKSIVSHRKYSFFPGINIALGIEHMKWCEEMIRKESGKEPTWQQVMAAYNCGYAKFKRGEWKVKNAPGSTQYYIKKIKDQLAKGKDSGHHTKKRAQEGQKV